MYSGSLRSTAFVLVQFTLIAAIAWHASIWGGVAQNAILVAAIVLGAWAILDMRFRVNIFPDVREGQQLHTSGPYRFIRHPMYTAVLLATAAWALNTPDVVSLLLWLALLIDLLLKLHHEEAMLRQRFSRYGAYMRHTKRLIPLVY